MVEKESLHRTRGEAPRQREDDLLSPSEFAAFLGVPVSTVHYWRRTGDAPPAIKVGKHLRWHREEVVEWIASRERT